MIKTSDEIKKMFNEISKNYDFLNDIISFFSHKYIKKEAVKLLKISDNACVLDLCSGSGDIIGIIKKLYPKVKSTGVDFSLNMLQTAKRKYPDIEFIEADVLNLPFLDNSFDFIAISFGLRNILNKDKALDEILRVLKQDGKLLHIDFGAKNLISKVFNFFVLSLVKIFKISKAYSYLIDSKEDFLTPEELITLFELKGYKFVKRKDFLFKTISAQVFKK